MTSFLAAPGRLVGSTSLLPCLRGCLSFASMETRWDCPKIGVPYFGVLIIRILLFRVLYFGKPQMQEGLTTLGPKPEMVPRGGLMLFGRQRRSVRKPGASSEVIRT